MYIYTYIYIYIYIHVYIYIFFHFCVCYVVLNQGCCEICQYSLPDRMLRHDFNTTLDQSSVNSHYFG